MSQTSGNDPLFNKKHVFFIASILFGSGLIAFIFQLVSNHPELAWQAYLVNFLFWSAMAQGGLLFSAVMHLVRARWTGPLSGLSESFAAFFPLSFLLFILLFFGKEHVFPWLYQDLHGKEMWLNLPFLFSRDLVGLFVLYAIGFVYLYYSLPLKITGEIGESEKTSQNSIRRLLHMRWNKSRHAREQYQKKSIVVSALYVTAFTLILSLIGYDLVMSSDPHWVSTLFGAYTFVKAFYIGLGALIILASILYLKHGRDSGIRTSHFHDLGKLFFAFCLLWADFFYVQFLVIWYGNIPEETTYIIARTMTQPWNSLAWTVFIVCFIIPFFILLNKTVKTKPGFMIILCSLVMVGIWLEHLLLLGPSLNHNVTMIPLGLTGVLVFLGFLGLMIFAVGTFLNYFPELQMTPGGFLGKSGEKVG